MIKIKLLSTMLIIAMLTSSFAGCTEGDVSENSSAETSQVSIESVADESKDKSEESASSILLINALASIQFS